MNSKDSSKPSPRLPYELIYEIMVMNLHFPSKGIKRHTTNTTLKRYFVTKKLYEEGQRVLKKEGSWRLEFDMRRPHVRLEVPPAWISDSVTMLALNIHARSLRFSDAKVEAVRDEIRSIRQACPQLRSIIVTLRVPPYDRIQAMSDNDTIPSPFLNPSPILNPSPYRFMRMWDILVHSLPTTVEHRMVKISTKGHDDPYSVTGLSVSYSHIPDALILYNHIAINVLPEDGKWVDLDPDSDKDEDVDEEGGAEEGEGKEMEPGTLLGQIRGLIIEEGDAEEQNAAE